VLSLILHHGIDLETSGISTPQSFAQMAITGLPNNTFVGLTDDSFQEFNKPFNQPTVANGNWGFQDNTDGGVLAGFPLPGNWTVNIAATFSGAPIAWEFLDGTANTFAPLDASVPLVLEARNQPSQCRLDCTVPTCGDGIFDAGEVCDDGNQVGGDGCAANCLSLAN
jgi:cysteine-rich repeat protein